MKIKPRDESPESEKGIPDQYINKVIDQTDCTRNQAIRALRESNGYYINAIINLTQWAVE